MKKNIILASASPRRKELLNVIGIDFKIMVSDKETEMDSKNPIIACETQARNKALDIANKMQEEGKEKDFLIIGADTIVAIENMVLGKPINEMTMRNMLQKISGKTHQVYTAVYIVDGEKHFHFVEMTNVKVAKLSDMEIEEYIASKEGMDKAGAYAIQGRFARYIVGIEGDYYNVMGLPIGRIYREYLSSYI